MRARHFGLLSFPSKFFVYVILLVIVYNGNASEKANENLSDLRDMCSRLLSDVQLLQSEGRQLDQGSIGDVRHHIARAIDKMEAAYGFERDTIVSEAEMETLISRARHLKALPYNTDVYGSQIKRTVTEIPVRTYERFMQQANIVEGPYADPGMSDGFAIAYFQSGLIHWSTVVYSTVENGASQIFSVTGNNPPRGPWRAEPYLVEVHTDKSTNTSVLKTTIFKIDSENKLHAVESFKQVVVCRHNCKMK